MLISESLDGFSVAAIRQNAGRVANPSPPWPPPRAPRAPGWMKPPAGTASARVIVVLGSASEARLSHEAPALIAAGVSIAFASSRARHVATDTEPPHLRIRFRNDMVVSFVPFVSFVFPGAFVSHWFTTIRWCRVRNPRTRSWSGNHFRDGRGSVYCPEEL